MKIIAKKVFWSMVCVLICSGLAFENVFGAELNDIVLDDGSVIRAEVVSFQNGKYTLRSESLGVFTLDSSRINQILRHQINQSVIPLGSPSQGSANLGAASSGSIQAPLFSSSTFQESVEKAQSVLMRDPEAMQVAASMASDPNFKELLDDPESVAALKSGDMATLLKNPRFLAIIQDAKMQEMANKVMNKSKE